MLALVLSATPFGAPAPAALSGTVHPSLELERVSSHFAAIKARIAGDAQLSKNKAIKAKLASISSKFERLEGAEEEKAEEIAPVDLERVEEAAPADLERVERRFEAIKK